MKKTFTAFVFLLFCFPISFALELKNLELEIFDTTPSVVPRNGVNISFLNISITPKEEDVYIKTLILKKTGLSDRTDVKGVRATTKFNRSFLGRVDNNDQVRLRFLKPVFIKKGNTSTFEITAHLNSKVGRTIGFELLNIETANGIEEKINYYNRPQYTERTTTKISSFQTQELSFKPLGSNNARLRFGKDSRIGRFRIQNEGKKNIILKHLTLKNNGTAKLDETFNELELLNNTSEVVSISNVLTSKEVSFSFNDILLHGGEGLTFDIWGTVIGGRHGRTIELVLNNEEDLIATLPNTGSTTRINSDTKNSSKNTLDEGTPTVYRNSNANFLWNQNYAPGSRDVIFLSKNIRHNMPILIEDILIFVNSRSVAYDKDNNGVSNEILDFESTFNEMSLYIDGRLQDQTDDFEVINNNQLIIRFTGGFELYNTANFMITGKISRQAVNGDRLRLTIDPKKSFPDWELLR